MRLKQLQHLVALAEHGSFVRAAQAVHLSQPAFSRSIEALEQALDARLVDRAYRAAHFTPAGDRALARARALLADAQSLRDEVQQLQGLEAGSLRVGLGPFAAGMLGRTALAELLRRHPKIAVHAEMADAATLCERLRRRELELFVADTRDCVQQSLLAITLLPAAPVDFFVRAGHPLVALAEGGAVTFAQLRAYPVGGPSLPLDVAQFFDAQAGPDLFSVVCDDPAALRQIALSGDAAILAPNAEAFARDTQPLVALRIQGLEAMHTHYGIITLAGHTPSAAAAAYARCVSAVAGEGAEPAFPQGPGGRIQRPVPGG